MSPKLTMLSRRRCPWRRCMSQSNVPKVDGLGEDPRRWLLNRCREGQCLRTRGFFPHMSQGTPLGISPPWRLNHLPDAMAMKITWHCLLADAWRFLDWVSPLTCL